MVCMNDIESIKLVNEGLAVDSLWEQAIERWNLFHLPHHTNATLPVPYPYPTLVLVLLVLHDNGKYCLVKTVTCANGSPVPSRICCSSGKTGEFKKKKRKQDNWWEGVSKWINRYLGIPHSWKFVKFFKQTKTFEKLGYSSGWEQTLKTGKKEREKRKLA